MGQAFRALKAIRHVPTDAPITQPYAQYRQSQPLVAGSQSAGD
jgi:hypothetical protein